MDLIHITTEPNPSTRLISKLVFSFRVTSHRLASKLAPRSKMPPKGSTIHPPKPPADAPPTAASIQMKANSVGMGEYELPKTTLTKLAKGSVSCFPVDNVDRLMG